MWFKMSQKIMKSVLMQDLTVPKFRGDRFGAERAFAVISLFCDTADGAADGLRDARDLSYLARISEKQAVIVWDTLKRHGVLQECNGGYSCTQWMRDAGIVGEKKRKEVAAAEPQRVQKPTDNPLASAFSAGFGNGGRTSFA